jgi:von Willebrand factor type A domain
MIRISCLGRAHRIALFLLLVAATAAAPFVRAGAKPEGGGAQTLARRPLPPQGRAIEAVFVLDTTGSMSGLLEGAKRKIWTIAGAMGGGVPVRIGLVAYRDRGDAYVTLRRDLTEDLDAVWGDLRALRAEGGGDTPESVNQALHEAVTRMGWSDGPGVYRVIFLVGDAPPHMDYQDDVAFAASAAAAASRDIIVNTIQCGSLPDTTPVWQQIARLAQGQFAAIDQDGAMLAVHTPLDERLSELNRRLALTVIPYGDAAEQAEVAAKSERALDAPPEAAAARLSYLAKRGGLANLGRKDLVDAAAAGEVDPGALAPAALPAPLQTLSAEERRKLVAEKVGERKELQENIAKLSAERDAYLAKQEAERGGDGFDAKVRAVVKEQAAKKGIH